MENKEFLENQKDMAEGILEIYQEFYGDSLEVYILDPNQHSGIEREIKFKKYLPPITMCGKLKEDETKKDRTDMGAVDTQFQYKRYISIPIKELEDNNIPINDSDLVRLKFKINGTEYFPYEVKYDSYIFQKVMVYRFTCRYEDKGLSRVRP